MTTQRDILVTQTFNELGIVLETKSKLLVRCRDCTHRANSGECKKISGGGHIIMPDGNHYCSYGERREP